MQEKNLTQMKEKNSCILSVLMAITKASDTVHSAILTAICQLQHKENLVAFIIAVKDRGKAPEKQVNNL